MTADLLLVPSVMSLDAAVRKMREHDRGSVLVVEDERLVGILTARDVLRAVAGASTRPTPPSGSG